MGSDNREMHDNIHSVTVQPDGNDPHPDTTELTTLYDASDGGTAEWWPGHIERVIDIINGEIVLKWKYTDPVEISQFNIVESHALAIVRNSAERWLRGRGWECVGLAYNTGHNYWCKEDWNLKGVESLADAIRAEMGRAKKLSDSSTPAT